MCPICRKARITFFAVQLNGGKPHINAWGENEYGHLVMFSSDHIQPRSRGGNNSLENRQPCCTPCNNAKGDKLPGEVESPSVVRARLHHDNRCDVRRDEINTLDYAETDIPEVRALKWQMWKKMRYLRKCLSESYINQLIGINVCEIVDFTEWDCKFGTAGLKFYMSGLNALCEYVRRCC